MAFLKIVAVVALLITIAQAHVLAPALGPPVYPAVRYTQVAPPSVLPFSAQVNTFTRNLHVFDAPYAAGVLPGPPAIVQRALAPAPLAPLAPAPFLHAHPYHAGFAPSWPAPYAGFPYHVARSVPYAGFPHHHHVHGVAPAPLLG